MTARTTPVPKPANTMRNFNEWEKSLRNFEWLGDAVPGGCDLDFICERKGHFLIIESKAWQKGIPVPYGQHLLLYRLTKQPKTRVYLVGEDADGDTLHLCHYNDAPAPIVRRRGRAEAWFPPDRFIPSNKDGLRTILKAWWADATGDK